MITQIEEYVKTWETRCYSNGIPDEIPNEIYDKAPSYKKICIAILKNDIREIGFTPKHSYYYDELKKIELSQRKNYVKQLKLF